MEEELKEAIKICLDSGLTVENKQGGYMRLVDWPEGRYLHQTSYRGSHAGTFESKVEDFLYESNIEE